MKILSAWLVPTCLVFCSQVLAHHSYYALYDVEQKIAITGTLVRFEFRQPHIEMEVLVEDSEGEVSLWFIESTSPKRWDRLVSTRQVARIGEVITLEGWPSRQGYDEMLLSRIDSHLGTTMVIDKVRQPRR